jgi:hypothetical protein
LAKGSKFCLDYFFLVGSVRFTSSSWLITFSWAMESDIPPSLTRPLSQALSSHVSLLLTLMHCLKDNV